MYSRPFDNPTAGFCPRRLGGIGRREKNASILLFSRVVNRFTVGILKRREVTLGSRDHSVGGSNQQGFST